MTSPQWLLAISIMLDTIMIAFPVVMLVKFIRREIAYRRRMRELDELARKRDFWGLMRWKDEYRKGKR